MFILEKRRKTALILTLSAAAVALFSAVGAVLLSLSGNYAPAVICALLCIFSSYCVPIYYKSMMSAKLSLMIFSAVENGADSIDAVSEQTGIEKAAALRFVSEAINSKSVTDYSLDGEKIIKNNTSEI